MNRGTAFGMYLAGLLLVFGGAMSQGHQESLSALSLVLACSGAALLAMSSTLALNLSISCSVTTNLSNNVIVKVATGEPPAALSSPQLSALQSYINEIGIAGVIYNVTSQESDKLYVQANVYYQGQYSAVIEQNVIEAIETFLSSIPFNGQMKVLDLERAIRAVEGVNDVVLVNVKARADATAFASGSFLVQDQQTIGRLWSTIAGYIVGETDSGNTLADSLTFIAE